MATYYKTLDQRLLTATAVTTCYSAPAGTPAIVSDITVVNTSTTTTATIKLWQTPSAATAVGDAYLLRPTLTVGPGESFTLKGAKTVGAEVAVKAQASVANVLNILIEGAEIAEAAPAWGDAACGLKRNVDQSCPSGDTVVLWNEQLYITDAGMHSTSTNSGRIVCTVSGVYSFSGAVNFSANTTGIRAVLYRVNGGANKYSSHWGTSPSGGTVLPFTFDVSLVAGDYVEIIAQHNTGTTLAIQSHTFLYAARQGYQTNPVDFVDKKLVDANGDLLVGTAADTVGRLPVGANGSVLTADSAQAGSMKWEKYGAARIYNNAGGALTHNELTRVGLSASDFDTEGTMADTTNSCIRARADGVYRINGGIGITDTANNCQIIVYLVKNLDTVAGVIGHTMGTAIGSTAYYPWAKQCTAAAKLVSGDRVDLYVRVYDASAVNRAFEAGKAYTFLELERVA